MVSDLEPTTSSEAPVNGTDLCVLDPVRLVKPPIGRVHVQEVRHGAAHGHRHRGPGAGGVCSRREDRQSVQRGHHSLAAITQQLQLVQLGRYFINETGNKTTCRLIVKNVKERSDIVVITTVILNDRIV